MAANEPTTKNLADLYKLARSTGTTSWDAGDQPHQGTGDRPARPPHLLVVDARRRRPPAHDRPRRLLGRRPLLLQRRTRSRKIPNIERDARCAFGVAIHGYDVALEGRAARVTDDAQPQRIARVFAEGGWAPTVASPTSSAPRAPARALVRLRVHARGRLRRDDREPGGRHSLGLPILIPSCSVGPSHHRDSEKACGRRLFRVSALNGGNTRSGRTSTGSAPAPNASPASRNADDRGAQRLTSHTRWVTRSPGTIVVGFSSRSGSPRRPAAKNGRPEPRTTGTWLTTTWSISPSSSAWLPI